MPERDIIALPKQEIHKKITQLEMKIEIEFADNRIMRNILHELLMISHELVHKVKDDE